MKVKKLLSTILAGAMMLSSVNFTVFAVDKVVAKIDEVEYTTLADAIAKAKDGDTITIMAGTYDMPQVQGKNITFKGAENKATTINMSHSGANGSSITFDSIVAVWPDGNEMNTPGYYSGLAHIENLTYKNSTIKGKQFLYATGEAIFENCEFINTTDNYCVWTYGASDVTFDFCTFNTDGKAVLVYTEDAHTATINVKNCTFKATTNRGKAAVEVGQSAYGNKAKYTLNITESTADTNFAANNSTSNLWGNKNSMPATDLTVEIDNEAVYAPVAVATIDDTVYYSLSDALNKLAADGGKLTLLNNVSAADYKTPVKLTKECTFDGKGFIIKDLTVPLVETTGANTTFDNVKIDGAKIHFTEYPTCSNGLGVAAYVCYVNSGNPTITFNNCELTNSEVIVDDGAESGGNYPRAAALIGYYDWGNVVVNGGKIEGNTIAANNGVGGVTAFTARPLTVEGTAIKQNTIKSTEDRNGKTIIAGTIVGTASLTASVVNISADVKENVTTQNIDSVEENVSTIYGRVLNSAHVTITGGAYDQEPIVESDTIKYAEDLYYDEESNEIKMFEVAEINGVIYASLEKALAAAKENDTIKLLQDVELNKGITFNGGNKTSYTELSAPYGLTFDLNGKTITFANETTNWWMLGTVGTGNDITFTGGTIDISGAKVSDSIFASNTYDKGTSKLIFNDTRIIGNEYICAYGVFYAGNSGIDIINSDIILNKDKSDLAWDGSVLVGQKDAKIVVDGTTITAENINNGIHYVDIEIKNESKIEFKNVAGTGLKEVSGTIDNSNVDIIGSKNGIIKGTNQNVTPSSLTLKNNSIVAVSDSQGNDLILEKGSQIDILDTSKLIYDESKASIGDESVIVLPRQIEVVIDSERVATGKTFTAKVIIKGEDISAAKYTLKYDTDYFECEQDMGETKGQLDFDAVLNDKVYADGEILAEYTFKALPYKATPVDKEFNLIGVAATTAQEREMLLSPETGIVNDLVEVITIKSASLGSGSVVKYELAFETNGGSELDSLLKIRNTTVDLSKYTTQKEGYSFDGWYSDKELTEKVTSVKITSDTVLYAKWVEGDNGYEEKPNYKPDIFAAEHNAYIVGREGGYIEPNANLTRAEAATIFFRLIDKDVRAEGITKENVFNDVNHEDWFNTAVSTLANLEVLQGRTQDTFAPDATITRAEFVTIVARLLDTGYTGEDMFTDISGHWAKEYINIATSIKWANGDSSEFRPDDNVTRAEAMTIINRALNRLPENASDLLDEMVTFVDNADENAWYYVNIQEATNSHDFEMKEDGVHEKWTKLNENPDWSELER